jgi:hypothetical protein
MSDAVSNHFQNWMDEYEAESREKFQKRPGLANDRKGKNVENDTARDDREERVKEPMTTCNYPEE